MAKKITRSAADWDLHGMFPLATKETELLELADNRPTSRKPRKTLKQKTRRGPSENKVSRSKREIKVNASPPGPN